MYYVQPCHVAMCVVLFAPCTINYALHKLRGTCGVKAQMHLEILITLHDSASEGWLIFGGECEHQKKPA